MTKIISRVVFGALVLSLVLTACAPAVSTPVALKPTLTPIKVKVVIVPFLSYAPFFIAQDEGYFVEQNLDVEFVNLTSATQAVPSLISGEIDVLPTPINTSHLNAVARGARIRVVADKGRYVPNHCVADALVVRASLLKERALNSAADLKGLKIALSPANYSNFLVETYLTSNGLTLDELQVVNLNADTARQAIEQGSIDAAVLGEPALTSDVAAGRVVVWRTGDQLTPNTQLSMLLYGPNLLDKNPDVGRRFMLAYFKAVQQYNQGATDRNLDIVVKYTKQDRALLKKACWQWITADGSIDVASISRFADWAVSKKLIDRAPSIDEIWDHSFSDYANQVLKTTP
jgi:NitT/TauT family transport system substrate-binding protein